MAAQHIVPEGYSTLIPLTSKPGGPVDKPVNKIAERLGVKPEQVLLAWSKAKKWVFLLSHFPPFLTIASLLGLEMTEDEL